MRKCIKTLFQPLQTFKTGLNSGDLEVCTNAYKHDFNHPRRLKISFKGLDSDGQEMHKNTFLTTPEVKKIIYEGLDSGGQEMHQITFFTTPEVKKIIF
jgi:hypothetical protein